MTTRRTMLAGMAAMPLAPAAAAAKVASPELVATIEAHKAASVALGKVNNGKSHQTQLLAHNDALMAVLHCPCACIEDVRAKAWHLIACPVFSAGILSADELSALLFSLAREA